MVARISLRLALAFVLWTMALGGCAAQPASAQGAPKGMPPAGVPREALLYRSDVIRAWHFYFGLGESFSTAFAQIHQESAFKATARSSAGALGLGQFTPPTAAWIASLLPADVRATCGQAGGCPLDPKWAIQAMCQYDKRLWGNASWAATPDDRWAVALAGYNGGEGWIPKERRAAIQMGLEDNRWWDNIERACVRRADACRENRDYPKVILRRWAPLYRGWLGA